MTEREFAVGVVRRLREAGHEALWAGGCVRDELLGLAPKDYDVATAARPEEVRHLFRRVRVVHQEREAEGRAPGGGGLQRRPAAESRRERSSRSDARRAGAHQLSRCRRR